jgi:hypothetical protein
MNDVKYNRWRDEFGLRDWVYISAWVGSILLILAVLVTLGLVGTNHSTHVSCLRLEEQTGLATKVARSGVDVECYILIPGVGWIPADRYRGVEMGT